MAICIRKKNGVRCKAEALADELYCEQCKREIAVENKKDDTQYRIGKIVRGALKSGKVFDIDRLK